MKVSVSGDCSCEFFDRILRGNEDMVDRTFTGDDVIRIYELFLDSAEQRQVEDFFREELEILGLPEDLQLTGLIRLVELFGDLLPLLLRLQPLAATFSTIGIAFLNSVIAQVAGLSAFLSAEIEARSVDA